MANKVMRKESGPLSVHSTTTPNLYHLGEGQKICSEDKWPKVRNPDSIEVIKIFQCALLWLELEIPLQCCTYYSLWTACFYIYHHSHNQVSRNNTHSDRPDSATMTHSEIRMENNSLKCFLDPEA